MKSSRFNQFRSAFPDLGYVVVVLVCSALSGVGLTAIDIAREASLSMMRRTAMLFHSGLVSSSPLSLLALAPAIFPR